MKISFIIIGIFVILLGGIGYFLTQPSYKVWILFVPIWIPNPFAVFRPVVWIALVLGAIALVAGLFKKE